MSEQQDDSRERSYFWEDVRDWAVALALVAFVLVALTLVVPGWYYG